MCISAAKAEFRGTKGYIGEINHPEHGLIHVLGYQNNARNLSEGPNALILHIPTREVMKKENVIDMGKGNQYLDKIVESYFDSGVMMKSVTNSRGIVANSSVEVFSHGIYEIALSATPSLINEALKEFPENKRPVIHPELMHWYEANYPGWTVAVCCFNNKDVRKSDSLFWWYKPLDENNLHFPAVDAHDGGLPKRGDVIVDHQIVVSSDRFEPIEEIPAHSKFLWPSQEAMTVYPYHRKMIPEAAIPFFGERLIGQEFTMTLMKNGDFGIASKELRKHRRSEIKRVNTL